MSGSKINISTCNRYSFSSESYPDLVIFIDKAKTCKNNHAKEYKELWKTVLPQNHELLRKLDKYEADDTINISSDSEDLPEEIISPINPNVVEETTTKPNKCAEYLAIVLQELKTEQCLIDITKLNNLEIEELFNCLSASGLHSDSVCLMGHSLISNGNIENTVALKFFCRTLLMVKLKETQEENILKVFVSILNLCPSVLCGELVKCFEDIGNADCPRALLENLKHLKAEHKEQLLREFILNCSKLENAHFSIIETLVANQVDLGILKKMMEMFSASSNEYSTNKSFGKLMIHIMQKVEHNIYRFEQDIQNIIANHKSPWRSKMQKLLESNTVHHNISQIF